MKVAFITVPYDSALQGIRMGAGPEHLVAAGLPGRLAALGHAVQIEEVLHEQEPPMEIRTGFELMRGVAARVRRAREAGSLPVVLSGNCNAAVGSVGGLGAGIGLIWFDAHGDFHTPDTTTSGFLDGTGLATATGRCWNALTATIPGFHAVPETGVLLLGVRDLESAERDALEASGVALLNPAAVREGHAVSRALDAMTARARGVYLHIDLDVLDPAYGSANAYAAPDGLSPAEVGVVVAMVSRRLPILAFGLASYDPACDTNGTICEAALGLAEVVVSRIAEARYARQP